MVGWARPGCLAVTAAAPDDDLAMLAEVSGVVIEILEARNADLETRN